MKRADANATRVILREDVKMKMVGAMPTKGSRNLGEVSIDVTNNSLVGY